MEGSYQDSHDSFGALLSMQPCSIERIEALEARLENGASFRAEERSEEALVPGSEGI